jgi:mRNA interferase MazF
MRKSEVWFIDLTDGKGHEQKGQRPAIVVGKANKMIQVIPLTSSPDRAMLPFTLLIEQRPNNGLSCDSVALIFQITSLDEVRFIKKIGEINEKQQNEIDTQIKEMLKLK